jgi:hypothetical protein
MTAQEIFSVVWERAKDQNFAVDTPETGVCMYRAPNGLKCFVGDLIPDDIYHKGIENHSAEELINNRNACARFFTAEDLEIDIAIEFILSLQSVHDKTEDPAEWPNDLIDIARSYSLRVPE